VGPQDPKDITQATARDLSGLVGELASMKAHANHWLKDPNYESLRLRLEMATPLRRRRWWRPGAG
jgi:hypothetical protein